MFNFGDILLDM
jgi:hypothetical protein